jgi:HK97 family phage major capsid protein
VTAEWAAEAAQAADASPTVGQITITPKRADAYVQASYELLADSGFSSELGRLLADAKDRLEGAAFATGNTGATKPYGVITIAAAVTTSIVPSAATNAFAIADLYSLVNAVPARYQANAKFLAHKAIYNKIRQFDTSGGAGLWVTLGGGRPGELLGYGAYEESTMQSAVTTGGLVLLHGDFSNYYIVDRIGMSVQYNPLVVGANQRPTGEAGWFAMWRTGADSVNPDAFRILQLNATAAAVAKA